MVYPKVEQRSEHRYPTTNEAWISLAGVPERHAARLVEISRSGLRVASDLQFAPGTDVTVSLERTQISGVVRHCERNGDSFFTGLSITEVKPC